MPKQFINPPGLMATNGWTHVVTASGGKTIYISGQVGMNDRGEVAKGDLKAQTKQTFENLKTNLAAAGATFKDVVKINIYMVNLKPEDLPVVREIRSQNVDMKQAPASTFVGISALVHPDWLIEIEATAVVES